jgi:hypothetical protein
VSEESEEDEEEDEEEGWGRVECAGGVLFFLGFLGCLEIGGLREVGYNNL